MRPTFIPYSANSLRVTGGCLLVLALGLGGCATSHARYPDPTQETQIRADEIRAESARSQEKITTDVAQLERALDFRANQTKTTAIHEREQIVLERDREAQPLGAEEREAKDASEREQARIDAELAAKLKAVDGAEAERLRAEAVSQKAVIEQKRTEDVAKSSAKRAKLDEKMREKTVAVDEREAKGSDEIMREREEVRRKARADRLVVENDTTKRLSEVGKDSKKRMDASSETAGDRLQQDRKVDQDIRGILDRDRDQTKDVSYETSRGVVTITGSIADDKLHRDMVSRISRIDGVVSVDDRIRTP